MVGQQDWHPASGWEHFYDWKRINSEGEQGVVSLETMIRGTCDPARLLDLVENFTLLWRSKGVWSSSLPRTINTWASITPSGQSRRIEALA